MKKIKIFLIILLFIVILFIVLIKNNVIIFPKGNIDGIHYSSFEKIEIETEGMATSEKVWDEMVICEQYNCIRNFNNSIYYNCNSKAIPNTVVNEKIDEVIFKVTYNSNDNVIATIYSIKEISTDVAIAVKFNNSNEYYTYINQVCSETTLEEFLNKYNLKNENLKFESIDYTKMKNNKKLVLENLQISNEKIKSLLFNNLELSLINFYDDIENPLITIHTESSIYGNGIVFYLTENNKLIVSIPSIKKSLACDIDANILKDLLDHIKENSNAHLKVYFEKYSLFESRINDQF